MPIKPSFLRQLSSKDSFNFSSKRWINTATSTSTTTTTRNNNKCSGGGGYERSLRKMEGFNMYGDENGGGGYMMRKRVMVVVDNSSCSKHAMIWALTHLTNRGDLLTLLHIIPPCHSQSQNDSSSSSSSYLANSLGSLCKACKPEVEVEALVIQGPKLATVMSQVKKLEVSVLVLGQKKPSTFINCSLFGSNIDDFVDECINNSECLTLGVRKQSRGMGGYLISSRWQKNFWLLA